MLAAGNALRNSSWGLGSVYALCARGHMHTLTLAFHCTNGPRRLAYELAERRLKENINIADVIPEGKQSTDRTLLTCKIDQLVRSGSTCENVHASTDFMQYTRAMRNIMST